ncbi:hypothetical protein HGM15179_004519 [Zosterops borbonicus]|uniref:Uncharacterized protein n=1 Tax=Zosterops borbonicus TaxID=364589 RepID=A0A8K1GS01_9PASS|nr:hypothetical protein HGM15179_004519 [Zosterops borbonicus]
MGNAAMMALEKATVDGLLKVATTTGKKIDRSDLVDLLFWCRRRGLLDSTGQIFDLAAWQKVGRELWEYVQIGAKDSKQLAKTYREVRMVIEQVHADAEVAKALQSAIAEGPENSLSPEEKETLADAERKEEQEKGYLDEWGDFAPPMPPMAAPAGFKGAFDDIIPPWIPEPPEDPPEVQGQQASAPPMPMDIDPAKVPLPKESPESPGLGRLLEAQKNVMEKILSEMKRIDGGASKPTRALAYQRAAQALKEGLENIEKQLDRQDASGSHPEQPPDKPKTLTKAQRLNLMDYAADGEMGVEELNDHLRETYGPGQG